MISFSGKKRVTSLLLLATLALRAAIPDGYMPAAAGSGLLFELCPAGVPAEFMQALAGEQHSHHHHQSESTDTHYDAGQCPIGHLLSSAVAFGDIAQVEAEPASPELVATQLPIFISRETAHYRSRGPPA